MSVDRPVGVGQRRRFFYDSIADTFDDVMNGYDVTRRLEVVFDEFLAGVDLRGKKVLDAGCGTGRFSERACRRGGAVTSVDIGPRLLQRVRGRCATDVVCSDVTRLSLPDDYFDVVISSECIEHTTSPQATVSELIRVCKPGGRLIITCPNRVWRWSCTLAHVAKIRAYQGLENWPGWYQLRGWITQSGGKIIDNTGIHLFPFVIGASQPLLRRLDRWGRTLGPLYVNQAFLAVKTNES